MLSVWLYFCPIADTIYESAVAVQSSQKTPHTNQQYSKFILPSPHMIQKAQFNPEEMPRLVNEPISWKWLKAARNSQEVMF